MNRNGILKYVLKNRNVRKHHLETNRTWKLFKAKVQALLQNLQKQKEQYKLYQKFGQVITWLVC